MFINPKHVIEQGWIQHPQCNTYQDWLDRKFVSPNAIDWTVDSMYTIVGDDRQSNEFYISEQSKQLIPNQSCRSYVHEGTKEEGWDVYQNECYDIMSNFYVEVPTGTLALLYIRSTFARVGCTISNTVWDQGFKGNVGSVLHTRKNGFIVKGCRIAQIGFIRAEDSGIVYAGGYNTANGQHWTETK